MSRVVGMVAAVLACLAVGTASAAAAPEPVTLTCGGIDFQVTVGSVLWGAASDVDSSTHFIPMSFWITITDESGDVVYEASYELSGQAHRNQSGQTTCTFTNTVEEDGHAYTRSGGADVVVRP
jgi:hypothetical protein